jgi:hypothetical protein
MTTVVACTGNAAARVSEAAPPLQGGVHCFQSVKRSYSLSAVVKRGMPVKVTCDGPARVQVITHAPAAVRRQAHPPATAGCLT